MRNLKKFLALVLAMMMTLSLMVTVNAADDKFTDGVTDKFVEAVDVLNGMKVFQGYEDGSFKPEKNISRAEVAAIVYRLATGDAEGKQAHLYASGAAKFGDVASDHWALGEIGYCANNLLVLGYDETHFGPSDNVTGVQALAMILRAVGYGKNNEFKGYGWDTNVYGVARGEGLLKNVDNTNYTGRLSQDATRELVAELLFQAAQIPTVNYQYGTYNKYTTTVTIAGADNEFNPSLGYKFYGLTYAEGVVVSNQANTLNQGYTLMSITRKGASNDKEPDNNADLKYAGAGAEAAVDTQRLNIETGLPMFGHKIGVWFNDTGRGDTFRKAKTVYSWKDEASKAMLLKAVTSADLAAGGASSIGDIIANSKSGFVAKDTTTPADTNDAFYSLSYGSFTAARIEEGDANIANYKSPDNLYMVISNSGAAANGDFPVDVIVSVNAEVSKVTGVNDWEIDAETVTVARNDTDETFAAQDGVIDQDTLLGECVKTLNAYEIGTAVGTIDHDATPAVGHNLRAIPKTVTKTVSAYYTGTDDNFKPDYVVVDGGEKIEKSLLFGAVADTDGAGALAMPQQDAGTFEAGKYKFYLDEEGKYIGHERVYDGNFLYGTYLDFQTSFGTGKFEYSLTGVTADGQVVTRPLNTVNGSAFDGNMADLGIYFHTSDVVAGGNASAVDKKAAGLGYRGVLIDAEGNLTDRANMSIAMLGWTQLGSAGNAHDGYPTQATVLGYWKAGPATSVKIDSRDVKVGAKLAYANGTIDTYLTANTKFYVVEGNGTGTLKVTPYDGIAALKGDSDIVTLKFGTDDEYLKQFCYTTSVFKYAADGTYSEQIDTIFLPKKAIERRGGSEAYFLPSETAVAHNAGSNASKFAFYLNGEKVERWIGGGTAISTDDSVTTGAVVDSKDGSLTEPGWNFLNPDEGGKLNTGEVAEMFFQLLPTTQKASDGEIIYQAVLIADADLGDYGIINTAQVGSAAPVTYLAATRNATVATIDGDLYNVADAKVVNLNSDYTIKDLGDLNNLSTIKGVTVYAVETEPGSASAAAIYVKGVA